LLAILIEAYNSASMNFFKLVNLFRHSLH